MNDTINLTEYAANKVREIIAENKIGDELVLRVKLKGGGCNGMETELFFDPLTPDDLVFESHNIKIAVDKMSIMYLDGTTIDYTEGLSGSGFKFNIPGSTSCGCGKSFSV